MSSSFRATWNIIDVEHSFNFKWYVIAAFYEGKIAARIMYSWQIDNSAIVKTSLFHSASFELNVFCAITPMKASRLDSSALGTVSALFERHARFARGSIDRCCRDFGKQWVCEFSELIGTMYSDNGALGSAIKGYGHFCLDSMRRQRQFDVEKRYQLRSYEDVAEHVYLNPKYMVEEYLPGLLLSHYLWHHHYQQILYFRTFAINCMQAHGIDRFAEVGIGTGIYSRIVLTSLPAVHATGYDISQHSIEFSQMHLDAFGVTSRFHSEVRNVITSPPATRYPWVFCVEVLEHLEDPVAMLSALKSITETGGRLFVTAALNAAHADHIYLYRQTQDVLDQVALAGLQVEHYFAANAYPPARSGCVVPSILAMVLINH